MTWADVYIAEMGNRFMKNIEKTALDHHPKVKAHVAKVFENPAISKYWKNKPNRFW